jgi:hypothetical protein
MPQEVSGSNFNGHGDRASCATAPRQPSGIVWATLRTRRDSLESSSAATSRCAEPHEEWAPTFDLSLLFADNFQEQANGLVAFATWNASFELINI